jgi:hypothetical protein
MMSLTNIRPHLVVGLMSAAAFGCGGTVEGSSNAAGGNNSATGAFQGIGGTQATGGAIATGGHAATAGVAATGGIQATGGVIATGGHAAVGGYVATGGVMATGGNSATGGFVATGGTTTTGGHAATGGVIATGGITATGGFAATGGATGGHLATGGTSASFATTGGTRAFGGTPATGGDASTGGSQACTGTGYRYHYCTWDHDCPVNEYCDMNVSTGPCRCSNGQWVCIDVSTHECYELPPDCIAGAASFADRLNGASCTVIVRVSADATRIMSYVVNCGPLKVTTQSDALNQLLLMSSIYWGGATAFGNSAETGIYAFATAGSEYTAYVSSTTRNRLLILRSPLIEGQGSVFAPIEWQDPSELGTTCIAASEPYYGLDAPGATSGPSAQAAVTLTMKTGLFRTLRAKVGPTTQIGVSYVDIAGPGYVLFITAS